MIVKTNDISINCEIIGEGENLILIHGAFDNLKMWYHQIPAFSKYYRVITYDVRGHGRTESPESDYSISLFSEDLYHFMKAMGVEKSYFLGFSMGGRIALNLAIDHPEMVKALILANSPMGLNPNASESEERRLVWQEIIRKGDSETFIELLTQNAFSSNYEKKNPTEFEKYRKIKLRNDPGTFARVMEALSALAIPPDFSKIRCPVLLIVGTHDIYMGVDQGKLAQKAISGSELVVLPSGHASAIEIPDKFNAAALEFIRKCEAGKGN
jgi:3-oxoadipate enol-lactonase